MLKCYHTGFIWWMILSIIYSDLQITQSALVVDVIQSGTRLTSVVHVHKVNENECSVELRVNSCADNRALDVRQNTDTQHYSK